MPGPDDKPEIEAAQEPIPNPQPADPAAAPPAPAPAAKVEQEPAAPSVDVEKALAEERAKFEREKAEAIEAAKAEAREQAIADERKRLEDEAKLAAMTEAERQASQLEAEKTKREQAEAKAKALEAEQAANQRRAAFAEALADSGLQLAKDAAGVIDPALRKLAFDEVQKALGDKPITPAAIVELREVKPWMFSRPEAEQKQESTNTGRGSSGTRVEPAPKQTNVFSMPDSEWRAARRKAGFLT